MYFLILIIYLFTLIIALSTISSLPPTCLSFLPPSLLYSFPFSLLPSLLPLFLSFRSFFPSFLLSLSFPILCTSLSYCMVNHQHMFRVEMVITGTFPFPVHKGNDYSILFCFVLFSMMLV